MFPNCSASRLLDSFRRLTISSLPPVYLMPWLNRAYCCRARPFRPSAAHCPTAFSVSGVSLTRGKTILGQILLAFATKPIVHFLEFDNSGAHRVRVIRTKDHVSSPPRTSEERVQYALSIQQRTAQSVPPVPAVSQGGHTHPQRRRSRSVCELVAACRSRLVDRVLRLIARQERLHHIGVLRHKLFCYFGLGFLRRRFIWDQTYQSVYDPGLKMAIRNGGTLFIRPHHLQGKSCFLR